MLKVYAYKGCGTCRKALQWLEKNKVSFDLIAIREQPPTKAELKAVLQRYDGNIRKLFNTSGQDYKELGMKDRLPGMSEADALDLLTKNGNLVKRPFVVAEQGGVVGFDEEEWKSAFRL